MLATQTPTVMESRMSVMWTRLAVSIVTSTARMIRVSWVAMTVMAISNQTLASLIVTATA